MNFLAHLYLCDRSEGEMLGALYGDFMRGYRVEQFPPNIQQGIRLHQYIDTCTDEHPVFRQSKRRISPERRRYAGILVDIFYDHFLALHWSDYSSRSLDSFTQGVYCLLTHNHETLPGRLKQIAPYLIRDNWLMRYRTEAGLARTFQGLARRIRRENSVASAMEELRDSRRDFEQDFAQFFPQMIQSVAQYQTSILRESSRLDEKFLRSR